MALFISTKKPNHILDDSPIDRAIVKMAARTALTRHQSALPKTPSLEVTFIYPGGSNTPPFSGMRIGHFIEDDETLCFEAVVPQHIALSSQASHYLKIVFEDVIHRARLFFDEHNVGFDEEQWQHAVRKLGGWQNTA